ncbi:hypothetical protein [Streptomyces sp. LBL]|uniref:hypothetical protein n=1 Tax=Streptomyces sp. LBL TaxID=2940562 RepID=UPI0024731649|nr:hypothetical protein [Streptomyces sp. LBL]
MWIVVRHLDAGAAGEERAAVRAVTRRPAARKAGVHGLADQWRQGHHAVAARGIRQAQHVGAAADVSLGAQVVEVDGQERARTQREPELRAAVASHADR